MWPLTRLRTRLRFYNVDGGIVPSALLQEGEGLLLQEDNENNVLDG